MTVAGIGNDEDFGAQIRWLQDCMFGMLCVVISWPAYLSRHRWRFPACEDWNDHEQWQKIAARVEAEPDFFCGAEVPPGLALARIPLGGRPTFDPGHAVPETTVANQGMPILGRPQGESAQGPGYSSASPTPDSRSMPTVGLGDEEDEEDDEEQQRYDRDSDFEEGGRKVDLLEDFLRRGSGSDDGIEHAENMDWKVSIVQACEQPMWARCGDQVARDDGCELVEDTKSMVVSVQAWIRQRTSVRSHVRLLLRSKRRKPSWKRLSKCQGPCLKEIL